MLLILLMQTLALPAILSVASVHLSKRLQLKSKSGLASLLLISWLLSSFWILGLPAFMPVQASDWFWIIALVSIILQHKPVDFNKGIGLTAIFAAAVIVKTWSVLTYHATFSSHILIWLEVFIFIAAGVFILLQTNDGRVNKTDNFIYAALLGVMGLTAAISGSITIALLCFSLASIIAASILFVGKQTTAVLHPLLLMLTLLLLLHVRQYTEASLLSLLTLLCSFALLYPLPLARKTRYSLIGVCLSFLATGLVTNA